MILTTMTVNHGYSDPNQSYAQFIGFADEIVFKIITGEENQTTALIKGEVDLIEESLAFDNVSMFIDDPNLVVNTSAAKTSYVYTFNSQQPSINDYPWSGCHSLLDRSRINNSTNRKPTPRINASPIVNTCPLFNQIRLPI